MTIITLDPTMEYRFTRNFIHMMIQKAATQYAVAGLNNVVFPYFFIAVGC